MKRILSLLILVTAFNSSPLHAVPSVLEGRAFYAEANRKITTAPAPWINLEKIVVPEKNDELHKLKNWLLNNEARYSTWPPVYKDESGAVQLVEEWRSILPLVKRQETTLLSAPELGALVVTFWRYGHHIDEPQAAETAFEQTEKLISKFPDAALPLTMKGIMLSTFLGKGAEDVLRKALTKAGEKDAAGLVQLAIAYHCQLSKKPHKMVSALEKALKLCPKCAEPYQSVISMMPNTVGSDKNEAMDNPYYFAETPQGARVGSYLFGFHLPLSSDWRPDRYRGYLPEQPTSELYLDAAPLEKPRIQHGMVISINVLPEGQTIKPGETINKIFGGMPDVKLTKIKPLTKQPHLTAWYRFDSSRKLVGDETFSGILVSGVIQPKSWTLQEHQKLALKEDVCEVPRLEPGNTSYLRAVTRIRAPIEIIINYNATKSTYPLAEQRMQEIISKLEIEDHAMSEFFAKKK
ncbi:MAG: hypothetical protein OEZ39_11965 [Gammaproteobacteria bacterium]|nr:hypothetical protein [Gammaproteobacteria bacterium]MDH5652559.1 hypothetical protein [Gammaproteobacteria bacterium]